MAPVGAQMMLRIITFTVAYPGYFTYSYCVNLRMCADNLILMAPLPIMVLSAKASRAEL